MLSGFKTIADDGTPVASGELRASYIINIAKLTRPKGNLSEEFAERFKLCVAGSDPELVQSLKQREDEKIHGKSINVLNFYDSRYLNTCDALVIANSEQNYLEKIFTQVKPHPIPTISEISGFTQSGGMYELYVDHGKLSFKANIACIEKSHLIADSRLLTLAGNPESSRSLECQP